MKNATGSQLAPASDSESDNDEEGNADNNDDGEESDVESSEPSEESDQESGIFLKTEHVINLTAFRK